MAMHKPFSFSAKRPVFPSPIFEGQSPLIDHKTLLLMLGIHARLYGQQRALAGALQHSMLTDPPEPEHCEIVVRYVPAAAGAEIGGDRDEAFLEPGGATVLGIGDVVGHDVRAAAAMGQLRGLLREIGRAHV